MNIGDRVMAIDGIPKGNTGTIVGFAKSGSPIILIDYDTWDKGHSGSLENGGCKPGHGYFMHEHQLKIIVSPKAPDVSGEYPEEMIPRFLETAKRIVSNGNCAGIDCAECARSGRYHHHESCQFGSSTCKIPPEWFKAFVDRYGVVESQRPKCPPVGDYNGANGTPRVHMVVSVDPTQWAERPKGSVSFTNRRKKMLHAK